MTSLGEKAAEADTQFVAVKNLNPGSMWRIESDDLESADDLGDESFPQHGDWLEVSTGGSVQYYLECPGGLAKAIVDTVQERGAESAEGYWFIVWEKERDGDGDNAPWRFDVELAAADVDTQEEAVDALRDDLQDG